MTVWVKPQASSGDFGSESGIADHIHSKPTEFRMTTIHIRRRLDSDTLPELKLFIGRTVDIIVREVAIATVKPGSGDWSAWAAPLTELADYDFDAWKAQRDYDVQHSNEQP